MRRENSDIALLCASQILSTVAVALVTVSVHYGLGKHDVDISGPNKILWNKYFILSTVFSVVAVPVSKTSFAVTLLRIAAKTWHKWAIWFIIVTMNFVMFLVAILLLAQCRPVERIWNKKVEGHCWTSVAQRHISIFAGCKFELSGDRERRDQRTLTRASSVFGVPGHGPRHVSHVHRLDSSDEQEGENWSYPCDEYGVPVSDYFAMHEQFRS